MSSHRKALFVTFMLVACFSLVLNVSSAQTDESGRWENGVSEPWWFDPTPMTKDEIGTAQKRWQSIHVENANAVADAWAGDYSEGEDTHGSYLRWSPQSGFVMMNVDKCRATVMSLDYGRAIATSSLVQLFPELNKRSSGHGHAHGSTMATSYVRVKWRGKRYLVNANRIGDFGDYVAGLGKLNDKFHLSFEGIEFFEKMNDSDEESKSQFTPIVPPEYKRFIKQPIDAIITGLGRTYVTRDPENEWWDRLVLPLILNVGSEHGLKRGMELALLKSPEGEMIEITRVGLRTSSGIIVRSTRKQPCVKIDATDDCTDPEYEKLAVGRKASTSPFRE